MSAGKILIVGLGLAGVAALVLSSKQASAAGPRTALPPGWSPPPGAREGKTQLPGVGTITVIRWADQTGGADSRGDIVLAFPAQDPTSFAAIFDPRDPSQPNGVMAMGDTPLSPTLAQALVAGVIS